MMEVIIDIHEQRGVTMKHGIKIFDDDYEWLHEHYGESWASEARRIIALAVHDQRQKVNHVSSIREQDASKHGENGLRIVSNADCVVWDVPCQNLNDENGTVHTARAIVALRSDTERQLMKSDALAFMRLWFAERHLTRWVVIPDHSDLAINRVVRPEETWVGLRL